MTCEREPDPCIDRAALHRVTGGDEALAREMLQLLQADLPQQQQALASALANGRLALTAELAHAMAGGAAYCGAIRLREACLDLERTSRTGDPAHSQGSFDAVEQAVRELLGAIVDEPAHDRTHCRC